MNTYTTDTFQKYERKRPSKHSLDTSPDEQCSESNCVKKGWRMSRENKRNWREE